MHLRAMGVSTRTSTIALVMTASLLLTGTVAALAAPSDERDPVPASFGEGARSVSERDVSREEARDGVDPAALKYYEKEYKVTRDVAQERLVTQSLGLGIGEELDHAWSNDLVAVWFDNESGVWMIAATDEVSADNVRRSMATHDLDDSYELRRVDYSHLDLVQSADTLTDDFYKLTDEGLVTVGGRAAEVTVTVSSEIDEENSKRVDERIRAAGAAGVPIRRIDVDGRQEIEATSVYCSYPTCDTLIGGDRYFFTAPAGGAQTRCTLAFTGTIWSGTTPQAQIILTADHCAQEAGQTVGSPTWVQSQRPPVMGSPQPAPQTIGSIWRGEFSSTGGDWGYVQVLTPPPTGFDPGLGHPYYGWHNWTSNSNDSLHYEYAYSVAPSGTVVCKNGGQAGDTYPWWATQCGTVSGMEQNVGINHLRVLQVDGMISCPGDSGAEVHAQSDTAVGILSGVMARPNPPYPNGCDSTTLITAMSHPHAYFDSLGKNLVMNIGP